MELGEALHGLQNMQGIAPGFQLSKDVCISRAQFSHCSVYTEDCSLA